MTRHQSLAAAVFKTSVLAALVISIAPAAAPRAEHATAAHFTMTATGELIRPVGYAPAVSRTRCDTGQAASVSSCQAGVRLT